MSTRPLEVKVNFNTNKATDTKRNSIIGTLQVPTFEVLSGYLNPSDTSDLALATRQAVQNMIRGILVETARERAYANLEAKTLEELNPETLDYESVLIEYTRNGRGCPFSDDELATFANQVKNVLTSVINTEDSLSRAERVGTLIANKFKTITGNSAMIGAVTDRLTQYTEAASEAELSANSAIIEFCFERLSRMAERSSNLADRI